MEHRIAERLGAAREASPPLQIAVMVLRKNGKNAFLVYSPNPPGKLSSEQFTFHLEPAALCPLHV
jgi:hypothetical protein